MKDKKLITPKHSIVRITGIFESENIAKTEQTFRNFGYLDEYINDTDDEKAKRKEFNKNYWYPEFRDIFFHKSDKNIAAKILTKDIHEQVEFLRKDGKSSFIVEVAAAELFLFPNGLHFFSISFSTDGFSLGQISDLTYFCRNFDTLLKSAAEIKWVNWVEKNILNDIRIYSGWDEKPIPVDEYSGSKFKLFTVLDIDREQSPEIDSTVIDELLYDIGCVAPINSANGDTELSPSSEYYNQLLQSKVSVFKNFSMLPLFDSFTTVGYNLLGGVHQKKTYNITYFRIYLFNLFIKYNLYRYNHEFRLDSLKTREKFESFLNNYNLSVISYNFLPNLIFEKHRESMRIEAELEKFESRINKITQAVQEVQQKRVNILLGLVTVVTSISSLEPLIGALTELENMLGWSDSVFFSALTFLLIMFAIPAASFFFPEHKRQLMRKLRKNGI